MYNYLVVVGTRTHRTGCSAESSQVNQFQDSSTILWFNMFLVNYTIRLEATFSCPFEKEMYIAPKKEMAVSRTESGTFQHTSAHSVSSDWAPPVG